VLCRYVFHADSLFCVVEPDPLVFVEIFCASILLGLLYLYSGSRIAVIIVHTIFDALCVLSLVAVVCMVAYWSRTLRSPHRGGARKHD
jgi:membrane protease YdiL (CAAX protease family)